MKELLEIIPTLTVEENTKISYLDFAITDNNVGLQLKQVNFVDLPELTDDYLLNSINNSNKNCIDFITKISKDKVLTKLSDKIGLASHYIANEGRMGYATHIFIPEKYNDIKINTDAIIKYYNEDYILVCRIESGSNDDIATCNNPYILNNNGNIKIFDKERKWIVRIDVVNEEDITNISPIINDKLNNVFTIPVLDNPFYMSSRSGKESDYKPYGNSEL